MTIQKPTVALLGPSPPPYGGIATYVQLLEDSEKKPEWFIETDCFVPTINIMGKEFVIGCSCNGVDKYEEFINRHARQIAEYLNKKSEGLIRTASEARLSNFLLWQVSYTEIYIANMYWPEFKKENLIEAILDYQKRKKKVGT